MGKRRTHPTDRERDLAKQIVEMEALATSAKEDGPLREAISARSHVTKMTADLERRRAVRLANAHKDPMVRLASLQHLAEADGSWIAASKLGADLRQLQEDLAAEAPPERDPSDMTHQELMDRAEAAALTYSVALCEPFVRRYLDLLGVTPERLGVMLMQLKEEGP